MKNIISQIFLIRIQYLVRNKIEFFDLVFNATMYSRVTIKFLPENKILIKNNKYLELIDHLYFSLRFIEFFPINPAFQDFD